VGVDAEQPERIAGRLTGTVWDRFNRLQASLRGTRAVEPPNQPSASRTPDGNDLVRLCRELNTHGVRYVVVGGFAMIQQGLVRTTEDVDLLLDPSRENQARVRESLLYLPDQAVRELGEEDLTQYVVARVADEILVDLMFAACGVTYAEAETAGGIEVHEVQGVSIPFASARLLWRMKQTVREKDAADRVWLRARLGLGDASTGPTVTVPRWLWLTVTGVAILLALAWVLWFVLGQRGVDQDSTPFPAWTLW
jgi:hypothetical protein